MSGYQGYPPPPYPGTQPAGYPPHPGYAPPAGYAPPPAGYASPPAGYAPPPAGYAPPPGGYPPASNPYPTGAAPPPEAAPYYPTSGYVSPTAPSSTPDRPPREQCFRIEHAPSAMVLEVEGAAVDVNTRVVTSYMNNADSQLWFEDVYTGTIKSRLNLLCLHVNEYNCVVMRPHVPGDTNQQWLRAADRVQNRQNPNKVLMVSSTGPGNNIMTTMRCDDQRQVWTFPSPGAAGAAQPPSGAVPAPAPAAPAKPAQGGLGKAIANLGKEIGKVMLDSAHGVASVVGDATPRRYFYIVSQMHGKVLDVEGGSHSPGTKVIMYPRKGGAADNQLWYLDEGGVIHSKLTGFVLQHTVGGVSLQKPTCQPGQQWTISGNRIVLKNNPNTCLDITGEKQEDCARLCQYQYKGSANQHWTFQYLPPRYFIIRSALNGKVLDVEAENRSPGARVIMWPRKSPLGANQLWYLDEESIIRSKLNNFTLQPGAGGIVLTPYSSQQNQQWTIRGRAIVLRGSPNKCLDIHSASRADGAKLCLYPYAKSPNQHWFYDYV